MISMFGRRLARVAIAAGLLVSLAGCYYMQAARGQLELMRKREAIDDLIDARAIPEELAGRLRLVQDARAFSIADLGLPDNDSYRSYADIERDYVVWNVVAAPEFSLRAKRWCFPVAGCVNYRGYFSERAAHREAARLAARGYDVAVRGVAAYSTLGKFSDPVLNTMMAWDDIDLVAVMFHELAHQVLYVKGDSGFNESFASAVEEFGVERWLASRTSDQDYELYRQRRQSRQRVMQIAAAARSDLEEIYSALSDDQQKRLRKQQRLERLTLDLSAELEARGHATPTWLRSGLNNARLASLILYHGRLPEFRQLLANCNGDIQCFYSRARELAEAASD